jgi:hypothetical protein
MTDGQSIDSGANGIILPSPTGNLVRKKMRRHALGNSIETQMRLHQLSQSILRDENNYTTLRAPYLAPPQQMAGGGGPPEYWMERIDTSHPLWLGDHDSVNCYSTNLIQDVTNELRRYWLAMWERGVVPWDFELYVQPDNSVVLLDFDKYAEMVNGSLTFARGINISLRDFFVHPSFPPEFGAQVGNPFRTNSID